MTRQTSTLNLAFLLLVATSIYAQQESSESKNLSRELVPQSLFVHVAEQQDEDAPADTQDDAAGTDAPIVINGETMAIDEYALFRKYDIANGDAELGPNKDKNPCDRRNLRHGHRMLQLGWRRGSNRGYGNNDITGCDGKYVGINDKYGYHKVKKHKRSKRGKEKGKGKGKGYYVPRDDDYNKATESPQPTASPTTNVATLMPTAASATSMPTMTIETSMPSLSGTTGFSDGPSIVPSGVMSPPLTSPTGPITVDPPVLEPLPTATPVLTSPVAVSPVIISPTGDPTSPTSSVPVPTLAPATPTPGIQPVTLPPIPSIPPVPPIPNIQPVTLPPIPSLPPAIPPIPGVEPVTVPPIPSIPPIPPVPDIQPVTLPPIPSIPPVPPIPGIPFP